MMRERLWAYVAGIVCLAVTSGGQILIPQFLRLAVDNISAGSIDLEYVGTVMLQMVGVSVVIAAGRFGWRYFIHGASRRIEAQLRRRLFHHFTTLDATFYTDSQIGDLMARSTNDMNAIRMASGMALVALFDGLFMTVAILIILFAQQPRIAALSIIPLPLVTVLILFVGRFIRTLFTRVQEGFSTLSQHTQEIFSGIRVVKSFVKEPYFLNRFQNANQEYQERNLKLVRIWGFFFPLVTFLSGLTSLLLLRFGGEAVIFGSLSPGEFVATLSYLEMLIWPMLGAGFTVNMLQRGAASLGRINEILNTEPRIQEAPEPVPYVRDTSIELRGLSFGYGDTAVLHDVSLQIPEGAILGILGRTGSGKSTLLKLLYRLYNPPPGTVYVGGVDVLAYKLAALRDTFGVVPQDTFLFSSTVSDNISYAVDGADPAMVRHVADVSTISRDVSTFPDGWETQIGERGITLSGGQKQRIAISRALGKQPRILVFDDALSAVDTETEEQILTELMGERRGSTSILVSHRVSTLSAADQIVVFDNGRIVQQGTHAELVEQDGFYREVFLLQELSQYEHGSGPWHGPLEDS